MSWRQIAKSTTSIACSSNTRDKIVQNPRFTEAFLRDSYRDEAGEELLRNAGSKADIVTDANIYVPGVRKDRWKFTSLYNQDPEAALEYCESRCLAYILECCCTNQCPRPEGPPFCHPSTRIPCQPPFT